MCTRFSGLEPPESAIRDLCFPSLVETCFLDVPLGACMGISASASTIGCKVSHYNDRLHGKNSEITPEVNRVER